ncbi:hypothetical protein C8Q78DRAFT_985276 [Trametes maxima]|nr:hypothetical protein C8Q78DRAFT_985276 [Trametes maxima]
MPSPLLFFLIWLLTLTGSGRAQSKAFRPAAVPLAIRSPFMNVWYMANNSVPPISNAWPMFWTNKNMPESVMGWTGKVRIDGVTYSWMGNDPQRNITMNVTNIQTTPTRSIFTMEAGSLMNISVTFLSMIEPSDWVLQSLPFSYLTVEVSSLDGKAHDVQLYSDISAEWLSGDRSSQVRWGSHNTTRGNTYHEIYLQSPVRGAENDFQAQDGKAYYAMAARPGQTWQIDRDAIAREQFMTQGRLTNTSSAGFASISPIYSVYAIAVDLGQIQSTSDPVTWAIGYVRDPTIFFTGSPGGKVQGLSPYFTTEYASDIGQTIDAVVTSFEDIYNRAVVFDQSIVGNASLVSSHYADLVSLVARQTFGALDITVPSGTIGQPDPSDVQIFMKDIGSSDSTERVTPVERLYAALPAFIYINASMLGPLLKPLLDAQANFKGLQYAARDLGEALTIRTSSESGNMLILLYAHARFSGDGTLISRHYVLAKRWSNYLINQTAAPTNHTSNMTNLAIKGIIGVAAMAEISRVMGQESDAQQFDSARARLVSSWQSHAFYEDQKRLLGVYGDSQSWALLYNIYADRLLGTNIVSDTFLQDQTVYYQSLLNSSTTGMRNIIHISRLTSQLFLAWTLLTAATVTDNGVRDRLIEGVWNRANSSMALGAFPDNYQPTSGATIDGQAGPAAGAMFSLLALK